MKKKTLTIGEMSEILNVSAATLRFWEKEDLIHVQKQSNRYRTYTTTDLISIADILYYRNLGVPVKNIREFSSVELSEYSHFLEAQEVQLNEKLLEYRQMLQRTERLKKNYYQLLRLMVHPFTVETPDFHHIVSWDFREKERIRKYIADPSCYVWCKDTNRPHSGRKGMILSDEEKYDPAGLVWEAVPGQTYITFPVKAVIEEDYAGLEAPGIIADVQRHTTTGVLIARHLLNCVVDGQNVEYLQAYLEITGPWKECFAKTLKLD